ncbi:hypothetical protein QBC44DRAFT_335603 [Cladorrhinum sp. PSN332]|nr:hypothetical protein QBC44DRAFT_335603 [Cladorrhinum sp. PSN332]
MSLPPLPPSAPIRLPQSCASISLPLLAFLDETLPQPPFLTLSIGSGPGLLEALFLHHFPKRSNSFLGVEVATPEGKANVNRFLKEENVVVVGGTWAVVDEDELLEEKVHVGGKEAEVGGLVFCYPRQTGLVKRYLDGSKMGVKLDVVVWIGPRCDEESFGEVFEDWGEREEVQEDGLVEEGEVVGVYRRRRGSEGRCAV